MQAEWARVKEFAGERVVERELVSRGDIIRHKTQRGAMPLLFLLAALGLPQAIDAQEGTAPGPAISATNRPSSHGETIPVYSDRITELTSATKTADVSSARVDYQIGPEDLLEISVLEAPDLNRTVRVSDDGAISLALLGSIQVAGLSTRELQTNLEDRLRQTYMKDPQVSVFVQEMRSHPVSVLGAVEKPGVYQIRYAKSLVEILSMAQGLANDAGDTVIIVRQGGDSADLTAAAAVGSKTSVTSGFSAPPEKSDSSRPGQAGDPNSGSESLSINLKDLLDSADPHSNVLVYPGDLVKVARAGIVYVVGQVHKPGGFLLKTNENISVLQAIALAEGVTSNSKGKEARIFLAAGANESRKEVAINLDKIMAGKEPAPMLKPDDVLFVPNSAGKEALHVLEQSTAGIVGALGGAAIYRW
jgi:polysaccharide export outer membrane protein